MRKSNLTTRILFPLAFATGVLFSGNANSQTFTQKIFKKMRNENSLEKFNLPSYVEEDYLKKAKRKGISPYQIYLEDNGFSPYQDDYINFPKEPRTYIRKVNGIYQIISEISDGYFVLGTSTIKKFAAEKSKNDLLFKFSEKSKEDLKKLDANDNFILGD